MHNLRLLQLNQMPIYEQLQIEEALLRAGSGNWCIINQGSPPAIVMGISGKYQEHVNPLSMQQQPVPVIRRFSGGGTVFVDEETLFFSLIGSKDVLDIPCFPDLLMQWTERLYAPAFHNIDFSLKDSDYTISKKKFGGSAQYICKDRWLHHSSFLWNYDIQRMNYLLMPKRTPAYRQGRAHDEFLCTLNAYFEHQQQLLDAMMAALRKVFLVQDVKLGEALAVMGKEHRRATSVYRH